MIVRNFLKALGAQIGHRDPMFYLSIIQKMKGEWYNQEGILLHFSNFKSWIFLLYFPYKI